MELMLIRHGLTEWNRERRYQGWTDIPLSETGLADAAALRDRMADFTFDAVFASDLTRTMTTAQLAFPSVTIRQMSALRELRFGAWEGKTYDELIALRGDMFSRWIDHPESVTPPEGESLIEFEQRVHGAIAQIIAEFDVAGNHRVAVVTHGGTIDAALRHLLNQPAPHRSIARIRPCGVAHLTLSPNGHTLHSLDEP